MEEMEAMDSENPFPSIHDLFNYYNQIYFGGKLGACTLQWSSKRMTLCAGVCQYSPYGGCDIRLSEPLLKYRPVSDLKNTLLHEMIHAFLFLSNGNRDHDDHGPCFQHMMMMINDFKLADEERPKDGYAITIYHNFTNEVDLYRTHHWKCLKCGDFIKRAMNRTPSVGDCFTRSNHCIHPKCHWHMHQKRCGGSYEKIHEPAGYVDKRKAKPVSADIGEPNSEHVDRDSAHLTVSGVKRKSDSNGGIPKKVTKEPPVQVKSLEEYFCPVEKKEAKNGHTETPDSEKDHVRKTSAEGSSPINGKNISPGETNGKRKLYMLNEVPQTESVSDRTGPEGKKVNLGSELALIKEGALDQDETKTVRQSKTSSSFSQGKVTMLSTAPARKEELGCFMNRKKYKTVDELPKKETRKEPLVILAWANWVSYESDEEYEEPLFDKRSLKRKPDWSSLPSKKGKTGVDLSDIIGLVPDSCLSPSESPMKTSCKDPRERKGKIGHVNQVLAVEDGKKQLPSKACFKENEYALINLSDDEEDLKRTTGDVKREEIYYWKRPTPSKNCSVSKQALSDLGALHKHDSGQEALTSATRSGVSEIDNGEEFSLIRVSQQLREESTTSTDIMTCPICNLIFRENECNIVINNHIDECLAKSV